ncbi:response regulator [Pengzhenrongella frigida]|uniref:Response regulator transcription factor n=1 Tax=Pengzhenrongella frigida TaxID=1259133 RepID=A0A4Q5N5F7_9MICO|nr:response regulator transcription factor [Cellulomonas sp. HLT2-17]RYV52743.1 response regulator transcription factor [Cellulomonas sp. HLT2-17]
MIDVVLTDDHPVVRAGLRAVIESEPDMRVIAELGTAEDLVARVRRREPADVLLVDLQFGPGRLGGADATRQILAAGGPPVLILTTYGSDSDILSAIEAGATGYLLKDAPTDELAAAIRAAASGAATLGPAIQARLLNRLRHPALSLTLRELEVLSLVALGRSNDAIARELFVSRATIKSHLAHTYDKLGVQSRTEAIATARRQGLLPS